MLSSIHYEMFECEAASLDSLDLRSATLCPASWLRCINNSDYEEMLHAYAALFDIPGQSMEMHTLFGLG